MSARQLSTKVACHATYSRENADRQDSVVLGSLTFRPGTNNWGDDIV
jgi:hypothetical protein